VGDITGRGLEVSAAPRKPPLAAAAVPTAARVTIDERRLVGIDASALSTLAGARGARLASPCKHENRVSHPRQSSTRPLERQLLTSRRRKPASSSSRSPLTSRARPAWPPPRLLPPPPLMRSLPCARAPPPRAQAPPWRAGTSAARAASAVDRLAAGAPTPAPAVDSLVTGVGSGDGGAGSHLLGRTCPLSSSSSSSSDDEYSSVPGEESPCCSHSQNSSLLRSRRSRRRAFLSLLRSTRSCSHRCAARASARDRGVGGSDRAAFTRTICRDQAKP
jgi:hypothetical protein